MNKQAVIEVSVIIPTYNRRDYLRAAVESIVGQTIKPFEIIVVNDGSDYNVEELLVDLTPRITIVNKDNGGKPTAVNMGVEQCRGTHIWVFDDDDIALPDYLEKCLVQLRVPGTDYVFGWHYAGKSKKNGGIEKSEKRTPRINSNEDIFVRLLEGCSIAHNAIIARKECYLQLGGIDTSYPCSEDYEFQLRLAKLYSGVFIDTPSFYRRLHDGERGKVGFEYEARERRQKFVEQDQRFILEYLQSLELDEYETRESRALTDESEKRRSLYIEKMCIAARIGLWEEFNSALQDMLSDEICTKNELSSAEKKSIRAMLAFPDEVLIVPFYASSTRLRKIIRNSSGTLVQEVRKCIRSGLFRNSYTLFRNKQLSSAIRSLKQYIIL